MVQRHAAEAWRLGEAGGRLGEARGRLGDGGRTRAPARGREQQQYGGLQQKIQVIYQKHHRYRGERKNRRFSKVVLFWKATDH